MKHTTPAVIAENELFRACEIIFGPELNITRDFLEYLQVSGIKTAYRKRAMETHPDRFAANGDMFLPQGTQLFHAVQEAYENLLRYLKARENGYRLPLNRQKTWTAGKGPAPCTSSTAQKSRRDSSAGNNGWRQKKEGPFARSGNNTSGQQNGAWRKASQATDLKTFWHTETFYSGPMPNRRLLFGHYLYYSGIITWKTVIQALVWQRTERPRLGELGRRYGMLTEDEVLIILKNRLPLKPFGETAIDLGLLTVSQLSSLMFHQKRLQKKFGEFFLERRLLRPEQLHRLVAKFQLHNSSTAGSCAWKKISS